MMTSSRPRDVGGSFASRRGHANQLSISDPSHHITETIGTLYGEGDDDYNDRPISFIEAAYGDEPPVKPRDELPSPEERRRRLARSASDKSADQEPPSIPANVDTNKRSQTVPNRLPSQGNNAFDGGSPLSPVAPASPTLREMRDDEASQFPLSNMENPGDIAQELSNLQALRRMSMDISNNNQDPDLLPMQDTIMAMPAIAPQGDDDEADPSRLLWVPANVHPELAPTAFKNFLEKRVQVMKRRSSDSMLSADSGLGRSDSVGSLRRKKSMLSRQVDRGAVDGGDRLDRRQSTNRGGSATPELTLDELMKDPSQAVKRLALEAQQQEPTGESAAKDTYILPQAPGMGLRRSKMTTYRKGGSLKNRHGGSLRSEPGNLPYAKRIAARKAEEEGFDLPSGAGSPVDAPKGHGLTRVLSEPITENHAQPQRPMRRQRTFMEEPAAGDSNRTEPESRKFVSERPAEQRRAPAEDSSRTSSPIPQIVESPAPEDDLGTAPAQPASRPFPERSSSQNGPVQSVPQPPQSPKDPPARSSRRPNYGPASPSAPQQQQKQQQQRREQPEQHEPSSRTPDSPAPTVGDMAHQPSPLPGGGATRTDSLTFIPTFIPEEKKLEKKSQKSDSENRSSRAPSWNKWFGKKEKDDDGKKSKKSTPEKVQDNARLDVLQTSIDAAKPKGRQSLTLDRESVDAKLDEERKKESNRKTSESKKEKDGLFANFFGGSKKKGDKDGGHRKSHSHQRQPSPEPPPYRPLKPDVDYYWTRFPILEERAIYRMAHIKLANPRRALHSQVLLSNFMYAYLAKVQAMNPQLQIPQSPAQKRQQEEERKRREEEQQQYLDQQEAQDSIDQYGFEYHRSGDQYGDPNMQHDGGDYPEQAELYDYDHSTVHDGSNGDYRDDGQRGDDDMW